MPRKDVIIETQILSTLREAPEGQNGTELLIVRYIREGRAFPPQLINREVYTDRLTKQRKHGKTKGLKWGDVKYLTENPERTAEILNILLDIPTRQRPQKFSGQDAAANDTREEAPAATPTPTTSDDDEVPF